MARSIPPTSASPDKFTGTFNFKWWLVGAQNILPAGTAKPAPWWFGWRRRLRRALPSLTTVGSARRGLSPTAITTCSSRSMPPADLGRGIGSDEASALQKR